MCHPNCKLSFFQMFGTDDYSEPSDEEVTEEDLRRPDFKLTHRRKSIGEDACGLVRGYVKAKYRQSTDDAFNICAGIDDEGSDNSMPHTRKSKNIKHINHYGYDCSPDDKNNKTAASKRKRGRPPAVKISENHCYNNEPNSLFDDSYVKAASKPKLSLSPSLLRRAPAGGKCVGSSSKLVEEAYERAQAKEVEKDWENLIKMFDQRRVVDSYNNVGRLVEGGDDVVSLDADVNIEMIIEISMEQARSYSMNFDSQQEMNMQQIKRLIMYDENSGDILRCFSSYDDAATFLGLETFESKYTENSTWVTKAYGFKWKVVHDSPPKAGSNSKSISARAITSTIFLSYVDFEKCQMTQSEILKIYHSYKNTKLSTNWIEMRHLDSNELLRYFCNASAAAQFLGCPSNLITKCCNGTRNGGSVYGFKWKYCGKLDIDCKCRMKLLSLLFGVTTT